MTYVANQSVEKIDDTNELLRIVIRELRKLELQHAEAFRVGVPTDRDVSVMEGVLQLGKDA